MKAADGLVAAGLAAVGWKKETVATGTTAAPSRGSDGTAAAGRAMALAWATAVEKLAKCAMALLATSAAVRK